MSVNPDHLASVGGRVGPQPWMQLRAVASTSAPATGPAYGVTGGGTKNDVLQDVTASWTNNTPTTQWVYGIVTHGGSKVALQARSRAYLRASHGLRMGGSGPVELVEVSRFGGGADIGMGGLLGVGTGYAIHDVRIPAWSVPLRPDLTGWLAVPPGGTVTGRAEVRLVSEVWEATPIDGGDGDTESAIIAGELRVDLFAIPQIAAPPPRLTPTVIGTATATETGKPVTVKRPAGVQTGDVLVAVVANQMGVGDDINAPTAGWVRLLSVGDGIWGFGDTHLRVFAKTAGLVEPESYTFSTSLWAEETVHLLVVRGAAPPGGDIDTAGWAVASTQRAFSLTSDRHVAPSITRAGQLLICGSYFGHTILQPGGMRQRGPDGMTQTCDAGGRASNLAVAHLAGPPNPTRERVFVPSVKPIFGGHSVAFSLLIPGGQAIDETIRG